MKTKVISIRLDASKLKYLESTLDFYHCSNISDFIKQAIVLKIADKLDSERLGGIERRLDECIAAITKLTDESSEFLKLAVKANQNAAKNIEDIAASLAKVANGIK